MISIISKTPSDPELQKWINSYSFLQSDVALSDIEYTHFPDLVATLNVYYNASVSIVENYRKISFDTASVPVGVLTNCMTTSHLITRIEGKYRSIVVSFRPTGSYRFEFMNLPILKPIVQCDLSDFWSQKQLIKANFISEVDLNEICLKLDEYFMGKLFIPSLPSIDDVTRLVDNFEGKINLKQVEANLEVHRRTVLRWFKKYLGCTFEEYVRIYKFRKALDEFERSALKGNLSDLAYIGGYYDQSDLIHQFKNLTGKTPKHIIKHLKHFSDQGLYWDFSS